MYVYFTPTEEHKRKCSKIRLQLWCRWIFPLFTLLNSTVLHISNMVSFRIAEPEPPLDQRSGIVKRPLNINVSPKLACIRQVLFFGSLKTNTDPLLLLGLIKDPIRQPILDLPVSQKQNLMYRTKQVILILYLQ